MAPRTRPPFRADLAAAYADEITALAALGCTYLQFDDTLFAFMNDPAWRQRAAEDKIVVLGLVTTKTPVLESKDDLKRRVEAAARYVDADRLCLSPQCGFASVVEGNALTPATQPVTSAPPHPRPPPVPTTGPPGNRWLPLTNGSIR